MQSDCRSVSERAPSAAAFGLPASLHYHRGLPAPRLRTRSARTGLPKDANAELGGPEALSHPLETASSNTGGTPGPAGLSLMVFPTSCGPISCVQRSWAVSAVKRCSKLNPELSLPPFALLFVMAKRDIDFQC